MALTIDAPRVPLAHLPTPLEPLNRLSEYLGGPHLWIKRDDCTGLATGGNKTRKLEFLLGEAITSNCDTVITFGAVQSNHARQTAAACAKQGLKCHLVLSRAVPWPDPHYETAGNVQLDRILGATVDIVDPDHAVEHARNVRAKLERDGRRVYVIPTGGSNDVGALGYALCAQEMLAQARQLGFVPASIIHATSSGGTQAGLALGLADTDVHLLGINVSDPNSQALHARITTLAIATRDRWAPSAAMPAIHIRNEFLGAGYGIPTEQAIDAIRVLAQLEGIVTDPVYSGKALGALFALVRNRELDAGKPVIFVHTGGVTALSAYAELR